MFISSDKTKDGEKKNRQVQKRMYTSSIEACIEWTTLHSLLPSSYL